MKTKVWPVKRQHNIYGVLAVSGTLLISTLSHAADPGYNDSAGDSRQFNINPGNMMDGMVNPMRNFFGGSDRYSNDYYNYRYAPPPAYAPPGYGYPGTAYPYPPGYPGYPGYQPPSHVGGYASPPSAQQPPAASVNTQPPPPVSTFRPAPSEQPAYTEQYRFRPLDSTDQPTGGPIAGPTYQESIPPTGYSATRQAVPPGAVPPGSHTMEPGYGPNFVPGSGTQEQRMIFRPLDKPGYSE